MVEKASKSQILDSGSIKIFCCICFIVLYIANGILHITGEMEKGISRVRVCFDEKYSIEGKSYAGPIFILSFVSSWVMIGLIHDALLYSHLKTKKINDKNTTVAIIPWKSTNEDNGLGIPLRATIISTFSSIIILVSSLMIPIFHGHLYGLINSMILQTVRLPLILGFTITHKKKVNKNQPPKGLQFHADHDESVSHNI